MATESKPIALNIACPDFKLKGIDDRDHQLVDYASSKVLVVGFTCNHCPYVQAYEKRLIDLVSLFKPLGASFVCINSNDDIAYPDDSFAKMKERAAEIGFNFDYLRDDTQSAARAFNAACTPEFYLYNQARKLVYHGRLDDNHKDIRAVKTRFLKDAIENILAGVAPRIAQTAAMGCSIKWK